MASLAQLKRQAEDQSMKALGAYQGPRAAEKASMKDLEDRREQTRRDFFKGREDITPGRLDRRQIQADLLEKFKKEQMKPVAGASGVLQSVRPGGPTTADEAMRLARMYGPTFKEIGSDIGYGIRSIGSALGQKFAAGELGIMGIAKELFEKFSNAVSASKKAIGDQINKLSDIDLERYKNKNQYKLTSQSPELQKIYQLEADELSARNTRDILGSRINEAISYGPSVLTPGQITIEEQVSTPVTSKVGSADLSVASSLGNRFGSTPVPNIIQQARTPDQLRLALLNQSYGMPDTEKPYLQQQDDYYYQDKERLSPKGDPYLYAANGGAVDQKLNNIQKKTNNIYGTGILSVR